MVTFLREMKGLKHDPPSTKPGAQFLVNQIFTQDDLKVIIENISTAYPAQPATQFVSCISSP